MKSFFNNPRHNRCCGYPPKARLFIIGLAIFIILTTFLPASGNQIIVVGDPIFGANEVVLVSGDIDFITDCEEGTPDGWPYTVLPAAFIYVVKDGQVSGYETSPVPLEDVSGVPNTIVSSMAGGGFFEEIIAYTWPSGDASRGKYDIVIDECQDGKFTPGVDFVLGLGGDWAFEVVLPPNVPAFYDPTILDAKYAADTMVAKWIKIGKDLPAGLRLFKFLYGLLGSRNWGDVFQATALEIRNNFCSELQEEEGFDVCLVLTGTPTPKPDAYSQYLDMGLHILESLSFQMAQHWAGLAADPPDSNFSELPVLGSIEILEAPSDTGITRVITDFINCARFQNELAAALLSSLEKYQGAREVDTAYYAILQAEFVRQYSDLLISDLNNISGYASDLLLEMNDVGTDSEISDYAADILDFQNRVIIDGLLPKEIFFLKNLGMSQSEIDSAIQVFEDEDLSYLDSIDIFNTLQDFNDYIPNIISKYQNLSLAAVDVLDSLYSFNDSLRPVSIPDSMFTGYDGVEGAAVLFDRNASYNPDYGTIIYSWELNNDGLFNDDSSEFPEYTYNHEQNSLVALKVSDDEGNFDIGYTALDITRSNYSPNADSIYPIEATQIVIVGNSMNLGLMVSDLDNDSLVLSWELDDVFIGDSDYYIYLPDSSDVGRHTIFCEVSDNNQYSNDLVVQWNILVQLPNQSPQITCPNDTTVDCDASTDPVDLGYATATDENDPDPVITYTDSITEGSCPQDLVISRVWTATDLGDSSSQCIQTITVVDTIPPEISCPSDVVISTGESTDPTNTGYATATDNCDIDPLITYSDSKTIDTTVRTWTASDTCGNFSECQQLITVFTLDEDSDDDGIPDPFDNCPMVYNPDQMDLNLNGIGDACECNRATYIFVGENAGDRLGSSAGVDITGDVNGDGYDDIIAGANNMGDGGNPTDAGEVYVYSGYDGSVLYTFSGEVTGDKFGMGAGNAGDVNDDGYADIVVGAREHAGSRGRAYVFSGINRDTLYVFNGASPGDQFGEDVASAGDVDADGYDDIIVGARKSGAGGTAYVFSGNTGDIIREVSGDHDGEDFGRSVSGVGDLDGDGFDDFIVGSPLSISNKGCAYLFSGQDGSRLFKFAGEFPEDRFGYSVSKAGDVNGDETGDIIVGAIWNGAGGIKAGRVYVYSGVDYSLLHIFTGRSVGGSLGIAVSGAGDLNGDGFDDMWAGAYLDNTMGDSSGQVFAYSGRDGRVLMTLMAKESGEIFGSSLSGNGDLNQDGIPDIVIGAPSNDSVGPNCGQVRAYLLGDPDSDNIASVCDNCPNDYNPDQDDSDGDEIGDICDNCPDTANYDQVDADVDSVGDVCDNCPSDYNPDQADSDIDGIGDICDDYTFGRAISFEKDSETYCRIETSSDFNFNNKVTFEALVYIDSSAEIASQWSYIFNKFVHNHEEKAFYIDQSGHVCIYLYPAVPNFHGFQQLSRNTWNHIAATYNGSDVKIYINGIQDTSISRSGYIANQFGAVHIGSRAAQSSFADFIIDEIRVWNIARSQTEIRNSMCEQLIGNESGLVGYWRFDEGTGDTAHDYSGNGNHARLGSLTGPDSNDPEWVMVPNPDNDIDGIANLCDNCPHDYNPDQIDIDGDEIGDICDNCPSDSNPDQADYDDDGIGDVCDPCPNLAGDECYNCIWEASSGYFPDNICPEWTLGDSVDTEIPEFIGDTLVISTSDFTEHMNYYQFDSSLNIPVTWVMEAKMKLISGGYNWSSRGPAQISFAVAPDSGIILFIRTDTVFLLSDDSIIGDIALVDTDSDFHTYRMVINNSDSVRVYYDDTFILSGNIFEWEGFYNGPIVNWGQSSRNAYGTSNWLYFKHNAYPFDQDYDGDGLSDSCDNCPGSGNSDQADLDGDGFGDICDNCADSANQDQADADNDGIGDVCDICPNDSLNDIDGDGYCADVDNCPDSANQDQSDVDEDGVGDICDICPNHPDDDCCNPTESNSPPEITSPAVDTAYPGQPYKYIASAFDPNCDGAELTVSIIDYPSWGGIYGDSLIGYIGCSYADTSFGVIVSDGELADTMTVTLTIENTNVAPQINSPGDTVFVYVLDSFTYYPDIYDPDDEDPLISYLKLPYWCCYDTLNDSCYDSCFVNNDSLLIYAPLVDTCIEDSIKISAYDYCSGDTLSFILKVILCGDVNSDCFVNIFDITYLIAYLYMNGPSPIPTVSIGDVNADGTVNIFDITYLISYLYLNGAPPVCQ